MRQRRRRAYTLMEVVLAMAIMVIMLAVGYPALDSLSAGIKVESGADAVRAAWAEAQAHAINEGRPYRFAVLPGKGNYRVAPDSADYWAGGGSAAVPDDPDNPPLVLDKALPRGVVFVEAGYNGPIEDGLTATSLPEGGVDPASLVTVAVFLPDGTARGDAEVTVATDGALPITLRLRALTGVVTVLR